MSNRYYATTGNQEALIIDVLNKENLIAGDSAVHVSVIKNGLYEVRSNGDVHLVHVVKRGEEFTRVMVNGRLCDVKTKSKGEKLIETLGLDKVKTKKLKNLKAPMPGLVLRVMVNEGQAIKKGDALLVLEAMKMENLIKAGADATVGGISVNEGQAVDKGQLLIKFS